MGVSLALRPGIARGFYPEREVPRETTLDRALHALHATVRKPRHASRSMQRFVGSVNERAASLETLSKTALRERVDALRPLLARDGATAELVAEVFSLIREAARRELGTPHYDVQLMAGYAMVQGQLAEMETGEGKTLSATLPAATAALAGVPVHVISANDYLVARDAEAMRPLYEALGLRVSAVTEPLRDPNARRAAWSADITYTTSAQVAFDYLRDGLERRRSGGRMALRLPGLVGVRPLSERLLLRGLCFAIVDEADSVLIDEARTPLILSGSASREPRDPRVYRSALELARSLEEGRHFQIGRRDGSLELTEAGTSLLAESEDAVLASGRQKEEWVSRALTALHGFHRDQHYLVREGCVEIIDQATGRTASGRAWERGLHQLIELKEGCETTEERTPLARISYQRLFRRYLRLAGTTGTGKEVAAELWRTYRLRTSIIPTRLPSQRRDCGTRVFACGEARWRAVAERVAELRECDRPVLIGTPSVAVSDALAERLAALGIAVQVLNARQDADEAALVASAGESGRVTVATAMAGRGTDIPVSEEIAERGGLHVITTQLAQARRIDRQLAGRCARQGQAGSHEAILALDDPPLQRFYPEAFRLWLAARASPGAALPALFGKPLTRLPQRADEQGHVGMRRQLVALEDYLGDLLAFAGAGE